MKKIKFPMGTAKAARLLNTSQRTIRTWCQRLNFSHIDPDNRLSPFQILTQEDFNLLKGKLNYNPGNPNWKKKKKS